MGSLLRHAQAGELRDLQQGGREAALCGSPPLSSS